MVVSEFEIGSKEVLECVEFTFAISLMVVGFSVVGTFDLIDECPIRETVEPSRAKIFA